MSSVTFKMTRPALSTRLVRLTGCNFVPVDWTLVGRLVVRETLTLFCLNSSSTIIFLLALQEKRQAAQERQRLNDTPHLLSRGGYSLLSERLMQSKFESSGLENIDDVEPPAQYELWKAARTKSDGQYSSQSTHLIVERIISKNICCLIVM